MVLKKNGAGDRTRTYDPIITNDVLYLLSYTGIFLLLRPRNEDATGYAPLVNDWLETSIESTRGQPMPRLPANASRWARIRS